MEAPFDGLLVRFIFLYDMGGSLLKYKMKGGGLSFFITWRAIKADKK